MKPLYESVPTPEQVWGKEDVPFMCACQVCVADCPCAGEDHIVICRHYRQTQESKYLPKKGNTNMSKQKTETTEAIHIAPPNIKMGEVWVKGTAPLVMHKFSHKARVQIKAKQEAGSTASKGNKKSAKNFEECFNESRHFSMEGWDGIPAAAFRKACISACRLVGFKMTYAKMSLFIVEDGWDRDEGTPLVKLIGGEPRMLESMVRIGGITKTVDISVRPQWLDWGARLRFRYDADQFTASDVVNLIARAGLQVGICEGRPDSSNSTGMGWGTFEVSDEKSVMALAKKGGAK